MLMPTLIIALAALALVAVGYFQGRGAHIEGLRLSLGQFVRILPLLVFAFLLAGMAQALVPSGLVSSWVGAESGLKGMAIGTAAGALTPGGPYVSLPLAAGFLRAGASVGTMVAYVTSWSIMNVGRMAMEVGIMGWRFTLIRLACSFVFPPLAGLLAQALTRSGT